MAEIYGKSSDVLGISNELDADLRIIDQELEELLKKQSAKQSKDLTIFTKLANELFNKIQQNINTLNENTVTLEKNIITVHENHKETRTVTNDLRRCCIEFAEMFNILINSETKKIPNLKNKSEKLN